MSIDLPKMPDPSAIYLHGCTREIPDGEYLFTADQLRAYAQEAARLALEAAAKAVADIEEKPWYGYENPNTFQDAIHKAEAAILAL